MDIQKFMEMLHQYIRDEFVAISKLNGNEITVRFNDGTEFNINVTEK